MLRGSQNETGCITRETIISSSYTLIVFVKAKQWK